MNSTNTVWHNATVTRTRREALHKHKGVVIWFTGLSGAGKSTLAHAVEERLHLEECRTFVLDGDNVRHGLCADLGFTHAERTENIRRVGETAKLFVEAGTIVLTAFISPFRSDRESVRTLLQNNDFIEVYCRCAIEICESRDVKGLYRKARAGEIADFTGISSPYEAPSHPELLIPTDELSLEQSVNAVLDFLKNRNLIDKL